MTLADSLRMWRNLPKPQRRQEAAIRRLYESNPAAAAELDALLADPSLFGARYQARRDEIVARYS